MYVHSNQIALRIGDDVTLASVDFLARGPPLSVVFTVRLSMTPAVGLPRVLLSHAPP